MNIQIKLTSKQEKIYNFIKDSQEKRKLSPTLKEIAKHIGSKSESNATQHIQSLEKKGLLKRDKWQNRGIELLDLTKGRTIIIRGVVPANYPIECFEDYQEMQIPWDMFSLDKDIFGLNVSGDSMIEDHICNGDIIFIERKQTANTGDIVVCSVDGEQTLKRYFPEENRIRLQPSNKDMNSIYVTGDFEIHGVLAGVFRRY